MSDDAGPKGIVEWLRWLRTTDHPGVVYVRELTTSIAAVLAVGLLLFAVSGVWPPMVAVESGSMQPNMHVGDLVFVMEKGRLSPGFAHDGVVSYRVGKREGYTKFSKPGDVIIYRPNNGSGTPIIHRARFWVNKGENWYGKANPDHIGGATDCQSLPNCPAPNAGFITKGDNAASNAEYDQVLGLSAPVNPNWIVGTAEVRIPVLGYVKLCASGAVRCPIYTTVPGPIVSGKMTLADRMIAGGTHADSTLTGGTHADRTIAGKTHADKTLGERAVTPALVNENSTAAPSASIDGETAAARARVSRPASG